jgi:predicted porin
MKKTLVALATLSAIGSAFADVDVSGGIKLYGVLDEAVQSQELQSPISTVASSTTTGLFSTAATSRLGVRGARDLGDGIKAELQVEIELDPDTSTLLPAKNRGTFVGFSSDNAGVIRLGTQETTAYEIFGNDVNGRVEYKPQVWRTTASSSTQDRANNSIKYISPEFMNTKIHLMRGFSEFSSIDTNAPNFYSAGIKFRQGNLKIEYVRDQLTHTSAGYAFYGQANAGVAKTKLTTSSINGTISSALLYYDGADTLKPIDRNILSMSYDFGSFSGNFIHADSTKTGSGRTIA